jgi:hypothetical protein
MTASLGHLPKAAAAEALPAADPPEVLPDLIAGLGSEGRPAPRDEALGPAPPPARPHQGRVQRAFERMNSPASPPRAGSAR